MAMDPEELVGMVLPSVLPKLHRSFKFHRRAALADEGASAGTLPYLGRWKAMQ